MRLAPVTPVTPVTQLSPLTLDVTNSPNVVPKYLTSSPRCLLLSILPRVISCTSPFAHSPIALGRPLAVTQGDHGDRAPPDEQTASELVPTRESSITPSARTRKRRRNSTASSLALLPVPDNTPVAVIIRWDGISSRLRADFRAEVAAHKHHWDTLDQIKIAYEAATHARMATEVCMYACLFVSMWQFVYYDRYCPITLIGLSCARVSLYACLVESRL